MTSQRASSSRLLAGGVSLDESGRVELGRRQEWLRDRGRVDRSVSHLRATPSGSDPSEGRLLRREKSKVRLPLRLA